MLWSSLAVSPATDLIEQTPMVTNTQLYRFSDTHARIPEHFINVDKVAKEAKTATLDFLRLGPRHVPLYNVYAESILGLKVNLYTFWGRGVSCCHPMLSGRIDGVLMLVNTLFLKNNNLEAIQMVKPRR